ncbi:uncharacterized 38.1 kDa protein isoform X4 [Lactuca sativa]|uniref:uncharacterized 38.1 kDa protein isoform X4 n=1 Tax=Lactuca sativa TaxID=4236 RepID=UPI0022AF8BEC|nr:uncharacterized 38.1 kDa protein isoform X4 [Lactuca sativa]
MANAVPSHQPPPLHTAVLVINNLATTAFLQPASVSPPLPSTSITSKSPPRYKKLSKAWRESKPPPKTPEEASRLVIRTLQRHQRPDIEVDARAVADGDTVTVYVSTSDAPESSRVPQEVHMAAVERNEARAHKNYTKADALQKQIKDAGYGVLHINNEEILARKYRIRLRGIDAPESAMPYGKEAKDELVKIIDGKCLKILIFDEDQYGRFVGDIYCNGIFVQELMLKKGLAWHYTAYDKRPELEKWEKSARAKRIGLWASSNPEMPWEWRKNRREHR